MKNLTQIIFIQNLLMPWILKHIYNNEIHCMVCILRKNNVSYSSNKTVDSNKINNFVNTLNT